MTASPILNVLIVLALIPPALLGLYVLWVICEIVILPVLWVFKPGLLMFAGVAGCWFYVQALDNGTPYDEWVLWASLIAAFIGTIWCQCLPDDLDVDLALAEASESIRNFFHSS